MVRGKTQMKRIENDTSRQVTFSKRRNGLLKKAFELSVLCDAEVALIIFSPRGKLYEFSSSRCYSINKTVERYQKKVKDLSLCSRGIQDNTQHDKHGTVGIQKKLEHLEISKRKLLGDCLDASSVEELNQIEKQLDRSLTKIRARKNQLFREQIEQLREEEKCLLKENERLREQCGIEERGSTRKDDENEVETELFIGPPERRIP
ncbi:agamous-like MADS-box protein AGL14 isoform X1 [Prosopis cineraria]|uniref:agamous-like MADS-box protein AGL14 isoform X1 n=1 Tax=Prosopis cineraria TaxID=364024 RepID=UPI00240EC420|nr:agamous-like MADS-box protein AGL14 isoform X1 [Prosopis cineraria]